jgi:uncharacterized protein (DUF433 family)
VKTAKATNFPGTLPSPQSDLVHQTLKDPYGFDFLTLGKEAQERNQPRKTLSVVVREVTQFSVRVTQYWWKVGGRMSVSYGWKNGYFYFLQFDVYNFGRNKTSGGWGMGENLIVTDPEILNGKPIVKGTRISVALILQCIASGMTKEEILGGYPTLTVQGLEAALDFAARQFQGEEVRFFENRAA